MSNKSCDVNVVQQQILSNKTRSGAAARMMHNDSMKCRVQLQSAKGEVSDRHQQDPDWAGGTDLYGFSSKICIQQ